MASPPAGSRKLRTGPAAGAALRPRRRVGRMPASLAVGAGTVGTTARGGGTGGAPSREPDIACSARAMSASRTRRPRSRLRGGAGVQRASCSRYGQSAGAWSASAHSVQSRRGPGGLRRYASPTWISDCVSSRASRTWSFCCRTPRKRDRWSERDVIPNHVPGSRACHVRLRPSVWLSWRSQRSARPT